MDLNEKRSISVTVVIRIRPLNRDKNEGDEAWTYDNTTIKEVNAAIDTAYVYDRVYGPSETTSQIYDTTLKRQVMDNALSGFNLTIFAYGQTGSGKSHTILGTRENPGLAPLAVIDLFEHMKADKTHEYFVKMASFEIYKEKLYDLLLASTETGDVAKDKPTKRDLRCRESPAGVYVDGLIEYAVTSAEQLIGMLRGPIESSRHIGSTGMNERSSRSHCVIRVDIEAYEVVPAEQGASPPESAIVRRRAELGINAAGLITTPTQTSHFGTFVQFSSLSLIDLAGSERANKAELGMMTTKSEQTERQREGAKINMSLLCLCKVIRTLADAQGSTPTHVPWRDSVLTRVLQPALGGNCATSVICTITTARAHSEETKATLQFGTSAKAVRNVMTRNEFASEESVVRKLKAEVDRLRAELEQRDSELAMAPDPALSANKAEFDAMAAELKKATRKNDQSSRTISDLRQELQSESQLIDDLETELSLKENEIQRLKSGNPDASTSSAAEAETNELLVKLRKQVAEANALAHERTNRLTDVETSLNAERDSLSQRLSAMTDCTKRLILGLRAIRNLATGSRPANPPPIVAFPSAKDVATEIDAAMEAVRVLLKSSKGSGFEVGSGVSIVPMAIKGMAAKAIVCRDDDELGVHSQPAGASASGSASNSSVQALEARIADLQQQLQQAEAEKLVVIDAKLRKLQGLVVRLNTKSNCLEASVAQLCAEFHRDDEGVKRARSIIAEANQRALQDDHQARGE